MFHQSFWTELLDFRMRSKRHSKMILRSQV